MVGEALTVEGFGDIVQPEVDNVKPGEYLGEDEKLGEGSGDTVFPGDDFGDNV